MSAVEQGVRKMNEWAGADFRQLRSISTERSIMKCIPLHKIRCWTLVLAGGAMTQQRVYTKSLIILSSLLQWSGCKPSELTCGTLDKVCLVYG